MGKRTIKVDNKHYFVVKDFVSKLEALTIPDGVKVDVKISFTFDKSVLLKDIDLTVLNS